MGKKRIKALVLLMVFVIFCANNLCFAITEEKNETSNKTKIVNEVVGKDKFEGFNRKIFKFNGVVNKCLVKPVNILWTSIVPNCAMKRFENCYTNIEYPKRAVSCLLQKDFKATGRETARFLINSTIGLGGLFDPAKNKFNIEPSKEDIEQALSKSKIKKGPYLVLPLIPPSNVRGYVGKALDWGLNPSNYLWGIAPVVAKAGAMANKTAYSQALIKNIEAFADPYDVSKTLQGIDEYIKNSNFDRKEVLAKIINSQKTENAEDEISSDISFSADMEFQNYESQSPVVDSMRTSLFELPNKKSAWNELSVWNRNFNKKIKSSNVKIDDDRDSYKFRYILQKNKKAPIAILFPSIGEGAFSHHPVVFAKILHDAGYSVIIQGNPFHWQFVKSAPENFKPGLPQRDAQYSRFVTWKILQKLQEKEKINPVNKVMIGTSYGALTTLFIAAEEEKNNILNISKYISISPPIDLIYAMKKLDFQLAKCNQSDEEMQQKTAIAASKLMQLYSLMEHQITPEDFKSFPLTEEEGIIATNFMMKQKLSDIVFSLENVSTNKKTDIYKKIDKMTFSDYFSKYLSKDSAKSAEEFTHEMSLYSLEKFLTKSNKYKIYEAVDDYFANDNQISWLKKTGMDRVVLLKNGAHLGFLYRKEFQDALKKDILPSENKEAVPTENL